MREHMLAALEMQLSGEPLAEAMGRTLALFSRDHLPPDRYLSLDAGLGGAIDLAGFSSAVESYEYSKQPMNNLAFESGAGVSLAYGPLLAPLGPGPGCSALVNLVQHLGPASHAQGTYTFDAGVARDGSDGGAPSNPLGWPGLWPTMAPFVAFDPTIAPTNAIAETCSITSDDNPGSGVALMSDDYECDANALRLVNRGAQVTSAISPGSIGWAGWKSALWVLNYLQVMHDVNEIGVTNVSASDAPLVGTPNNTVLALDDAGEVAGTYLGSSEIEGFQAGMMISEYDNAAESLLKAWMTSDGTTLSGFPSLAKALQADDSVAFAWFPAEISVVESPNADCPYFPQPTAYAVQSPDSHLLDLAGILGTYASFYALTDTANPNVGGADPAFVYFDGDPFPADDPRVFGDNSLHDRALAVLRIALLQILRGHVDPSSGIPVDDATLSNGTLTPGATLGTSTAAYALLGLRTARRALSDLLTLYTNTTPDMAVVSTPIDSPPLSASSGTTATMFLNTTIGKLSELFYDHLTDATGRAYAGWDVSKGSVVGEDDLLDSHTAAVRGLLLAFLSTGDVKYRDRALAVFARADSEFWENGARLYRTGASDSSSSVTYTPMRFALVQGMLRDVYELIAVHGGQSDLAALVEGRLARMNKLVLNGWDDRNGNQVVDWPEECVMQGEVGGATIGLGGLQMAERTLSGETGSLEDTFGATRHVTLDREHDCVPEVSSVGLPAALADSITFTIAGAQR